MKDNFDLRKYLIENKMTENSRGDKRHHLTESVYLNTKILSEAEYRDQDLDLDQLDDEDFDPQEALAAYDAAMQDMGGEGVGFEDPENLEEEYQFDGSNPTLEQFIDAIENRLYKHEEVSGESGDEDNDYIITTKPGVVIVDVASLRQGNGQYISFDSMKTWKSADDCSEEELQKALSALGQGSKISVDDTSVVNQISQELSLDECGGMDMELDEASYVDDDDDFARDLDFTAGDDLAAKIGGRQAKKLADKSISQEFSDDDDDSDRTRSSSAEDEDAPTLGKKFKPGDWVKEMKSWGHDIDWDNIEFEMDDEELNRYLGSFNRPNVAAKFLADHLRSAQKEVDYGPRKKMYFVLKNDGYYGTANFRGALNQTRFIATIYKNEENSKKYYDEY